MDKILLEKTVKVVEIEKSCVLRNMHKACNRDCAKCDLVLPDSEVIGAYNTVLSILYTLINLDKGEGK